MLHHIMPENQLDLPIVLSVVRPEDRKDGVIKTHDLVSTKANSWQVLLQSAMPFLKSSVELFDLFQPAISNIPSKPDPFSVC
eukprot:Skav212412  [mRNA]  locus=scaffold202:1126:1371:+ [translate_table: standard]